MGVESNSKQGVVIGSDTTLKKELNQMSGKFTSFGEESTVIAGESEKGKRRVSSAIETEIDLVDKRLIQEMFNDGASLNDIFTEVTQSRRERGRALITRPAVERFYNTCTKQSSSELCVFTGDKTNVAVNMSVKVGKIPLGNIMVPCSPDLAAEIESGTLEMSAESFSMSKLNSKSRIASGEHIKVLPGSSWRKLKANK